MNKDPNIEKLFAESVTDCEPKKELLAPALDELKKQNARKKSRREFFRNFGVAFSAAAVVLIVSLSVILPRVFSPSHKGDSSPSPIAPDYYTVSEITQSDTVSAASKNALPQITHIGGVAALPESVTEYRFADGTAAYASIAYRRRGRYGIEDVKITAEFAGNVFEKFEEFYSLMQPSGFNYTARREDGEYIALCAMQKDGVKYYIDIMCANRIEIEYYSKIFG